MHQIQMCTSTTYRVKIYIRFLTVKCVLVVLKV